MIACIAAFWAGFYQRWLRGPDFDILFGSFVLGSAVFLGIVPTLGHRLASTIALLGFPVGCFLGQLLILAAVVTLGVVPNLQGSDLQHSVYWICVGVSMGVIGGAISGLALRRMLTTMSRTDVRFRIVVWERWHCLVICRGHARIALFECDYDPQRFVPVRVLVQARRCGER
jgi:hypothetical protein